ncbi:hypothetical protein EB796_020129 [Bugula neritina]|uniref:Uncharacterized protein n=1 Tax=Bugula neritina TaxID=10212 RepID=A0A7J7J737_BUGNE|nr:hypothetical protein EB796_020129 [Bugula neritina]
MSLQPLDFIVAGYKAAHLDSKQNARLKHSRRNNLSAETAKAESFEVESRRSRSQAASRSNSRSHSSSRSSSQAKMYSVS